MGQFCSWRPCAQTRSLGRQASLGLPLQHTLRAWLMLRSQAWPHLLGKGCGMPLESTVP